MSKHTFPKKLRLLRTSEFDRVFQQRCSAGDGMVIIYAAPNEVTHPRLGLTVSRKVGRAVVRNRWKRSLREAFRLTQPELPAIDLICIPRPAAQPEMRRLMSALPKLAAQLEKKLRRQAQRNKSTEVRRQPKK